MESGETRQSYDSIVDEFQLLIRHGHSFNDILRYTHKQFVLFVRAANKQRKRELFNGYYLTLAATNPTTESNKSIIAQFAE